MNTNGTITWIPATEENVKMIPVLDRYRTETVHLKFGEDFISDRGIGYYDATNCEVLRHSNTKHIETKPTHFAFINEPE